MSARPPLQAAAAGWLAPCWHRKISESRNPLIEANAAKLSRHQTERKGLRAVTFAHRGWTADKYFEAMRPTALKRKLMKESMQARLDDSRAAHRQFPSRDGPFESGGGEALMERYDRKVALRSAVPPVSNHQPEVRACPPGWAESAG